MSAFDWSALLASLEHQRAALDDERADIDAVIETVRRRATGNGVVPSSLAPIKAYTRTPSPPIRPIAKNGGGKGGRGATPEMEKAKAAAKKLWEAGRPVKQIATTVKKTVAIIYQWSSSEKWKRPKTAAPAHVNGAAEKLAGSVRCTSCDVYTEYDPCEHCGHKLKRNW